MSKLALGFVVALSACAATKRSNAAYRADTQRLIEARRGQLEACYASVLEKDAAAGGLVTVLVNVERKTGTTKITAIPDHSSAPQPVTMCVLGALAGIQLAPPDANEGRGTFAFDLQPKT